MGAGFRSYTALSSFSSCCAQNVVHFMSWYADLFCFALLSMILQRNLFRVEEACLGVASCLSEHMIQSLCGIHYLF